MTVLSSRPCLPALVAAGLVALAAAAAPARAATAASVAARSGAAAPADPAAAPRAPAPVPVPASPARPAAALAPPGRYNVGATHSPRLLRMLARGHAVSPAAAAGEVQGVDVASFQHPAGQAIDWAQVAAAGYRFAFIKATEGSYYANPYYPLDAAAAKAAGLLVAAYHFAIPNDSSGTLQADFALNMAGTTPDGGTLPLILDIEYDPYVSLDHTNECYGLSQAAMVSWIGSFTSEVLRRTGEPPVIYTTAGWWSACTGGSTAFARDRLWIADYAPAGPSLPAGWPNWAYWQYTSSGTVPGIPGKVDLSYFNAAYLTVARPGTQSFPAGAAVLDGVHALNAAAGESLTFTAAGLPRGLAIGAASGQIYGRLADTPGRYPVAVTVAAPGGADSTGRVAGRTTFPWQVGPPPAGPSGRVRLALASLCLAYPPAARIIGLWTCRRSDGQVWEWAANGTLRLRGRCLAVAEPPAGPAVLALQACDRAPAQQWQPEAGGALVNALTGQCLAGPRGRAGTAAGLAACAGAADQAWTLPAGPLAAGLPGRCLAALPGRRSRTPRVVLARCAIAARAAAAGQAWTVTPAGAVSVLHVPGRCLAVARGAADPGAAVGLSPCQRTAPGQVWRPMPGIGGSFLVNPASGLCLAVPAQVRPGRPATALAYCRSGSARLAWRFG